MHHARYDENHGSSAGQTDDVADSDRERHDGKVTNLRRMTKGTNLRDDVAEVDEVAKETSKLRFLIFISIPQTAKSNSVNTRTDKISTHLPSNGGLHRIGALSQSRNWT